MTQINLLPAEVLTRQRVRRYTTAAVGAVGAAVVLVLLVFVLQSIRLAAVERDLEAQRQRNASVQAEVTRLRPFEELKSRLAAKQALVAGLLHQRVLWSSVLRNVSAALPGDLWLTSMNAQLNPSAAPGATGATGTATAAATGTGVIGTIQFQGSTFEHPTVGRWLTRLEQVRGWENAWVSSSTKQVAGTGDELVNFTNSVDLTTEAAADGRQK